VEALLRRNNLTHCINWMVFKTVWVLSGWLQRNAADRWQEVLTRSEQGRPAPSPPALSAAPSAFKSKELESLDDKGSTGDAVRLEVRSSILPHWAREVQPFLNNQLSHHTRRAYETDLKQFFRFLEGRIDVKTLKGLRSEHIILFRKYLEEGRISGKPFEKSSINRKLAVIKSFFDWLQANHVALDNPASRVKGFPQNQESKLLGLSDEEASRMMEIPNRNSRSGAMHQAALSTLLYLGLRKGELIGLKMGDLDSERGVPVLRVRGKGHRVRVLPLTDLLRARLDHYFTVCGRDRMDKEAPLFTPTRNPRFGVTHKALNPNAITYLVVRYAVKAGVLKKISPHSCRATCISNALDRKATHRSVQHLAGWSTPLMIQRYDKRREDLKNSAAFTIDYSAA
jgi:integrase/recombinase XerD